MKIIRLNKLNYEPSSHEDPKSPGALKKVMLAKDDLVPGRVQMINWAKIPARKSFAGHYHEDMEEIFIILSGKVKITVGKEKEVVERGDLVVVPASMVHIMENLTDDDVEYLAIGVSGQKGGKTVIV